MELASTHITIERPVPGVAVVVIDRADKANCIDDPMHYVLTTVWGQLERDRSLRCLVLTGRGSIFCGGGDFNGWKPLLTDRAHRRMKVNEARGILVNMLRCELPIVAAVNGPATGLGCSLVLASDLVIMGESAYLTDPHVKHNIVAGDGGAALLPHLIPIPVARDILWTGRQVAAAEAASLRLAQEVVPNGKVLDRAIEVAADLAERAPEALRDTKRSINLSLLLQALPAIEFANATESASFDTDEFRGRVSFLNRSDQFGRGD